MAGLKGTMPTSGKIPAEIHLQPSEDFVITPAINALTDRALAYLEIGYAVHLSGPAGTGKTTLAMHIASKLNRPCTLLHGDDEMRSSDLVGKDSGYKKQSVRDNYVSSILKTEETVTLLWNSNRLTTACENGHTLIYDEFTRSPAAANNVLLSVLEEKILNIPSSTLDRGYIQVHPDFRAIFTSNPSEYIGVHKTQDALLDRMITLEVTYQDRDTEIAIVRAKSNRESAEIAMIVDVVRRLRERLGSNSGPTIRAALAISSILDHRSAKVGLQDPVFLDTCHDVLYYNAVRQSNVKLSREDLNSIIRDVLPGDSRTTSRIRTVESKLSLHSNIDLQSNTVPNSIDSSISVLKATEQLAGELKQAVSASSIAALAESNKKHAALLSSEILAAPSQPSDVSSESTSRRDSLVRSIPRPPSSDVSAMAST